MVEPVERLRGCHDVGRVVIEWNQLGGAEHRGGLRRRSAQSLEHLGERLDGRHAVADLEKATRELAGAGAEIDDVERRRPREPLDGLAWILGTRPLVHVGHGGERRRTRDQLVSAGVHRPSVTTRTMLACVGRRYPRRMPRATVALVLVALAAGCGGTDTNGDDTFAYDEDAPLAVEAGARVERDDPLVVREVSFASGNGRVEGYLAMPPRSDGRVPGVVYLHGSGGERSQLLPLAEWLAARGAVALTLTLPSGSATPPAGLTPEETLRWQRDTIVADAVAVRRAFDTLAADERVDPDRLGLVGWSFGGRLGAIVAGVDDRVDATALMSAGAAPVSEYVAAAPADLRDDVEDVLTPIDPLSRIAEAKGDVLLQAGRSDSVVPEPALQALADAAPDDAELRWYEAEHDLDDRARREQLDWLTERLGIDGPPVSGAATGP